MAAPDDPRASPGGRPPGPEGGANTSPARTVLSSVERAMPLPWSLGGAGPAGTPAAPEVGLVRAACRGDRDAFGALYRRYARMVHGVLLARVPRRCVDDLVQDVFLLALGRMHALRDPAAFPGWLAAIARNRAVDHLRGSRDTVEIPDDLPAPETPGGETFRVLALLRTLPEAYRETLVLRLVEGMTGPEIAARTGLTEGSVRVNLHRGIRLLRERLGVNERNEGSRDEP